MSYKVIHGKYWVKGFSPDGDSIRFTANNLENQKWFKWTKNGNLKKANENKVIKMQLRLEAIDALETHYNNKYHQPRSFAIAAMNQLLKLLGLAIIRYSIDFTKITDADDGKGGFIISSGLDIYDRPISFVYSGICNIPDGQEFDSYPEEYIKESINYKLLEQGIVYPTFYSGIDNTIVTIYSEATRTARNESKGLWAIDSTNDFIFWETWTIQDDVIILPKLFRRLADFIDDYSNYDELSKYFNKSKDPLKLIQNNTDTDLKKLIKIDGRRISLEENPENMLFMPK